MQTAALHIQNGYALSATRGNFGTSGTRQIGVLHMLMAGSGPTLLMARLARCPLLAKADMRLDKG
jgi:hypothetical protein